MTCSVCGSEAVVKGRCRACYRFWVRHGRLADRDIAQVVARRYEAEEYRDELREVIRRARAALV